MSEPALKAAYRAIGTRLATPPILSGSKSVGVYAVKVEQKAKGQQGPTRPYFIFRRAAGGERNFEVRKGDPEYVIDVKAVAEDWEMAASLAQEASERLDDQGEQDLGALVGGADWHIIKAMREGDISMTYSVGTATVYEEGFQLRVTMEEK